MTEAEKLDLIAATLREKGPGGLLDLLAKWPAHDKMEGDKRHDRNPD